MSYFEIYKKRANRYGIDYQSRIQGKREDSFDLFLLKSIYRIDFYYNQLLIPGVFEKYKQDETETLHYLLTRTDVNIPNGTILEIPDKDNVKKNWMVYYLEHIKASGYNRYIMLRMTHYLTWVKKDGTSHNSWAYLYGQEDNMLKNELRSRSRMDTVYTENLKSSFFILPTNENIKKDDYFIIGTGKLQEYYRVTGYDIQSSEGVEYVTIDPIYEYDLTPPPVKEATDSSDDFFWLEGGQ